jgi:hypothetical protein
MLRGAFPYSKMPRLGRIVLPNYPHHVVQRGHNKQAVFAEEADYLYYLNTLEEFKDLYDIPIFRLKIDRFSPLARVIARFLAPDFFHFVAMQMQLFCT